MTGEKKLSEKDKKNLESTAKEFLDAIHEKVSMYLLLEDIGGLGRLVTQVKILGGYEVIESLWDKGMRKEITELCDKAGRKKEASM